MLSAATGLPAEGKLEPFLGKPRFEMQQVFNGQRLPNVVVATDGTVLAAWGWGQVRVRRAKHPLDRPPRGRQGLDRDPEPEALLIHN